ncbi:L-threonine synthase [Propioniferax innocua]|uniref:Threonine synthase n=2 Tax=Propioniferax innocua TaxID=1753 RepID=A0A542ZBH9_9ACTN|nr:L-threonine synthase [Propioniferax innocua]
MEFRAAHPGIIDRYREWLPVEDGEHVASLGEGSTPLVPAPVLSKKLRGEVWIKVEGANPTGSFKDRGMTVAVTKAAAEGAEAVVCASTGNTSASAAAYAVRAGLKPIVLLPSGKIAKGKLAQAIVYGAQIVQVDGNFDQCLTVARKLAENYPVALVNSVNPHRLEGQKTAAFEIVDALGTAPDMHVMPIGNAGNMPAYWRGFCQYAEAGRTDRRPVMWAVQAEGAAPLVLGHPVLEPETIATAIRIGNPASADLAKQAREESGGRFLAVSDQQILEAQRFLASKEGVFVEPASASGVAALLAAAERGDVEPGQLITVTVTGNGLKDIDTALSGIETSPDVVTPEASAVASAIGLA